MKSFRHGSWRLRVRAQDRSAAAAFTLIEMLVVVGIIAILLSLLFPALEKAQISSMKAACVSNLRQTYLAAVAYETDSGGYMPMPFNHGNCTGTKTAEQLSYGDTQWYKLLPEQYLGLGPLDYTSPKQSVLTCPIAFELFPYPYTYSENHSICRISNDGSNGTGNTDIDSTPIKRTMMLRPLLNNVSPAATIPYFLDGRTWGDWYASWAHYGLDGFMTTEDYKVRSYPHDDGANLVFLDGHVEWMRRGTGLWQGSGTWWDPAHNINGIGELAF